MLMPAIALWIVWRLSADYLDPDKRLAGRGAADVGAVLQFPRAQVQRQHRADAAVGGDHVFLSALVSHAQPALRRARRRLRRRLRCWANTGRCSCWPASSLAALIDRRRAAYFRSAAPWVTMAVGAARARAASGLARQNRLRAVRLCRGRAWRPRRSPIRCVSALGYLGGSVGYVAVPVIVVLIAARPGARTLADMIWPADAERRLAAAAFWAPLLLPVPVALASGTEITSLWSMSAWTLLPVVLLSPRGRYAARDRHAAPDRGRRRGAAGGAHRLAVHRHQRPAPRAAAGLGARQPSGRRGRAAVASDNARAVALCRRRTRSCRRGCDLCRRPAARAHRHAGAGRG